MYTAFHEISIVLDYVHILQSIHAYISSVMKWGSGRFSGFTCGAAVTLSGQLPERFIRAKVAMSEWLGGLGGLAPGVSWEFHGILPDS